MPDEPEIKAAPVFDPSIQSEKIAFEAEQLVICDGCGRSNPPNRLKCIYCAHDLQPPDATDVRFGTLRKLELWERGSNLILMACSQEARRDKAASLLGTSAEMLEAGSSPRPIARVESEGEAGLLRDALLSHGFECTIVPDADLQPDRLPVRLRHIGFEDSSLLLTTFNTGEVVRFSPADLTVAVVGHLFEGRVDTSAIRGRKGKSKLLDETETGSDELVLDLYTTGDLTGYRINHSGFDFSGLGTDKSLLVSQNMRLMVDRLRAAAPSMRVVEDYSDVRHLLDTVWEPESKKDPQGLRRTGHRVEFGMVSTTSNLDQFTRYSRLQQLLYEAQTA